MLRYALAAVALQLRWLRYFLVGNCKGLHYIVVESPLALLHLLRYLLASILSRLRTSMTRCTLVNLRLALSSSRTCIEKVDFVTFTAVIEVLEQSFDMNYQHFFAQVLSCQRLEYF